MRKRCGLTRHRSDGHCKVRSLNHRVKCDYSVQRIVTSTNVTSYNCFATVKGMKYAMTMLSQHCCVKNNRRQSGFMSRMLFYKLYKIVVCKVTFVGFGGVGRPNRHSLDPPLLENWQLLQPYCFGHVWQNRLIETGFQIQQSEQIGNRSFRDTVGTVPSKS